MGGKTNKKIVYDAYCVVAKNKSCAYKDRMECVGSYNQMAMNTVSNPASTGAVSFDDVAVPVRIMLDPTGKDMGDDWTISSCVPELDYAAIMRWWPKSWFVKPDGTLVEKLEVSYGPIDLHLTVVDVEPSVMEDSFSDVILPEDDIVESVIQQENDMFKKKSIVKTQENDMGKTKAVGFDKDENLTSEVIDQIDEVEAPEDHQAPEVPATPVNTDTDAVNAYHAKHDKLKRGLKAGLIVAAAGALGFGIYKIVSIVRAADGCDSAEGGDTVVE